MRFIRRLSIWLTDRAIIAIVVVLLLAALALFIVVWRAFNTLPQEPERAALAIAAAATIFAAVGALANLVQAAVAEWQRRRAERPNVVAYFDGDSGGFIHLAFENMGNSPACNVRFHFDPDPINFQGQPLSKVSVFAYPISFLPQGKRYRQLIEAGHRFLAEGKPTKFSITTSYESPEGEQFKDTRDHDLAYLKQANTPLKTTEDHLKEIKDTLDELVKATEARS